MKTKFSIGWLLAIIAALVIGVIKFFSFSFNSVGEYVGLGILWSAILVGVLLFVVFLLTKAKTTLVPLHFRNASVYELLLLIVFLFGLFITIVLNNHFFVVLDKQEIIKNSVDNQVNQMDAMFNDYINHVDNRLEAHKAYLKEVKKNRNSNYSRYQAEQLDVYEIDDLLIMLEDEIACDSSVLESVEVWKNDVLRKTSTLGMVALMPRLKEINSKLEEVREDLKARDRVSDKGLNGPHWDYSLSINNDILQYFKKGEQESINVWSVIITLLLSVVVLLPYLSAVRDGRHRGLLVELTTQRKGAGSGNIGGI